MRHDRAAVEEKLLESDRELTSLRGAIGALCNHVISVGMDVAPSAARLEIAGWGASRS